MRLRWRDNNLKIGFEPREIFNFRVLKGFISSFV